MKTKVIVRRRQNESASRPWRQYVIVRDRSVTLLDEHNVDGAWVTTSMVVQDEASETEWKGMCAQQIDNWRRVVGLGDAPVSEIEAARALRLEAEYVAQLRREAGLR